MGKLTNLNPSAEFQAADAAHVAATDPHLQYATQARGDARYARKYSQYFRAAPSVSQGLSQDVVTKISFNTVTSNIGNQYFANTHRLVALETEIWRITTAIEFNLPTNSRFLLWLAKNGGSNLIQLWDFTTVSFVGMTITPADITLLSGEYLEVWARILNISTGSVYGNSSLNTCWWEGSRVG
jgi:hypothetical protein